MDRPQKRARVEDDASGSRPTQNQGPAQQQYTTTPVPAGTAAQQLPPTYPPIVCQQYGVPEPPPQAAYHPMYHAPFNMPPQYQHPGNHPHSAYYRAYSAPPHPPPFGHYHGTQMQTQMLPQGYMQQCMRSAFASLQEQPAQSHQRPLGQLAAPSKADLGSFQGLKQDDHPKLTLAKIPCLNEDVVRDIALEAALRHPDVLHAVLAAYRNKHESPEESEASETGGEAFETSGEEAPLPTAQAPQLAVDSDFSHVVDHVKYILNGKYTSSRSSEEFGIAFMAQGDILTAIEGIKRNSLEETSFNTKLSALESLASIGEFIVNTPPTNLGREMRHQLQYDDTLAKVMSEILLHMTHHEFEIAKEEFTLRVDSLQDEVSQCDMDMGLKKVLDMLVADESEVEPSDDEPT